MLLLNGDTIYVCIYSYMCLCICLYVVCLFMYLYNCFCEFAYVNISGWQIILNNLQSKSESPIHFQWKNAFFTLKIWKMYKKLHLNDLKELLDSLICPLERPAILSKPSPTIWHPGIFYVYVCLFWLYSAIFGSEIMLKMQ